MKWKFDSESGRMLGEKIGKVLGCLIVIGLIIAGIMAWISNDLTFMDIVLPIVKFVAMWLSVFVLLIAGIGILIAILIRIIPAIMILLGFFALFFLFQGEIVAGLVCLAIAGFLFFKLF